jgi:hypothetical protein
MPTNSRTQSTVDRIRADALDNARRFTTLHPLARAFLLRADEIDAGQKVQGSEVVRLTKDWLRMVRASLSRGRPRDFRR